MGHPLSKSATEQQPQSATQAGFMFKHYGPSSIKYLSGPLYRRQLGMAVITLGSFGIPKLVFLHAQQKILEMLNKLNEKDFSFGIWRPLNN